MTELTTDRVTRLEAYKDALDAAGVEYDTRVTYRIELAENGTDSPLESEEPEALPGPGTKTYDVVEAVAEHPMEWVGVNDVVSEVDIDQEHVSTILSHLYTRYGVAERKKLDSTGGRPPYGYRLKEAYRRELTGQSIDVDVLTEARNA